MALTLANLKLHAQHAATLDSTTLPPGTTSDAAAGQIVNQAGRYLFKHLWNFRIAPPAIVGFTAPISVTSATYGLTNKSITKTSGFSSYTFAKGDIFEVTAGTGATTGLYTITSKESNNEIRLATAIGAADGITNVSGTIEFPYVNLPSDFGDLIALEMNSTYACVFLTSLEEVISMRLRNVAVNANHYRAAVVQPGQTAATSVLPVARLELDHAPTAADPDVMFVMYRRSWTTLSTDTHYAEVPEWAEDLLVEYIRAFAEGYMNRHGDSQGILPVVTTSDRLADIDTGPLFKMTKEYDGLIQSDYGPTGDGPAGHPYHATTWRSRTSGAVADPA